MLKTNKQTNKKTPNNINRRAVSFSNSPLEKKI